MSIAARLPEMTLADLTQLEANATRLAGGTPGKQRDAAAALLPLVEAELAGRREAKAAVVREKKPRAPRKAKTPLTESEKADALVAGIDEALARK